VCAGLWSFPSVSSCHSPRAVFSAAVCSPSDAKSAPSPATPDPGSPSAHRNLVRPGSGKSFQSNPSKSLLSPRGSGPTPKRNGTSM
jgi:hypothetical protein